jgi:hypothetical protein
MHFHAPVPGRQSGHPDFAWPLEIGAHCAALPDVDSRTPDEILGYDEAGMWR